MSAERKIAEGAAAREWRALSRSKRVVLGNANPKTRELHGIDVGGRFATAMQPDLVREDWHLTPWGLLVREAGLDG